MSPRHNSGQRADPPPAIPEQVLQQAEQAAAVDNDDDASRSEKRHAGHDVPPDHPDVASPTAADADVPPPAYGEEYGSFSKDQDGLGTKAKVGDDGRVNIRIDQRSKKLSDLLVPALRHQQDIADHEPKLSKPYIPPSLGGDASIPAPPPMNVVIHVVGSRGDVQPFVALGKVLTDTYGHRVRLATHGTFQKFVTENGLEFFNIGGDPAELMAFMVKNPGLMPGFDTLRTGDVGKRRKEIGEMIKGCWRSCYETGDGMGPSADDNTQEDWMSGSSVAGVDVDRPFIADVIIANPPSFAHIHCAEKLGIPLHMMFTMPYSPTQAFPHPLANIQSSNADPNITNYISYTLVETMTWQGLGDVINTFRARSLGLEPISLMWAPGMLQRLKIPYTYCWSPALIPKPKDWAQHISISGFYFLNLASNYTPDPDLQVFLDAGPPPVYIGFGSIVLDDPNAMTKLIFEAVEKTGQRALVSKGWGGVGADQLGIPDSVYMLGNVPHDWLFKHVSCVVHHGGAGTTAAGITAGRPTLVVPFFGDQPFWGSMVARAGAGPEPIHHKSLTSDNLASGIMKCLEPQSQEKAHAMAASIAKESGSNTGAQSFHQMLETDKLRCNLDPSRVAVWRLKRTQVRLSAFAATTLANEGQLTFAELKLFRPREYEVDDGPWDPVTGGATSIIGTASQMMMGIADMPIETLKALHIHPDSNKKPDGNNSPRGSRPGSVAGRNSQDTSAPATPTEPASTAGESSSASMPPSSSSRIGSGASTPATTPRGSVFNLEESLSKLNTQNSDSGTLSPGRGNKKSSFMAEALRGQLSKTTTRSRSGSRTRKGGESAGERDLSRMYDTAMGTGKGVQKIVGAGMKSPMDFTMALAQGFHNAPKLYNDDTVRKHEKVTDFKSGLRAATKEFGFGMYDGITGLATQPIRGAKKEGAAGFIKGVGKGIGGIMLKPGAAIFSIPGYTMKGVYKEMQQRMGSSVHNYIVAARTAQGYDDWNRSSARERSDIVERWSDMQKNLKKKKNPDEMMMEILSDTHRRNRQWLSDHRKELSFRPRSRGSSTSRVGMRSAEIPGYRDPESARLATEGSSQSGLQHAQTWEGRDSDNVAFEEAIRLSVQQTSKGNPDQDAAVERAIRASLTELSKSAGPGAQEESDEDALRRAMQASIEEAKQQNRHGDIDEDDLKRAIEQSMKEQKHKYSGDKEWSSDPDTEDDEDYKAAIAASKKDAIPTFQVPEDPDVSVPNAAPPAYGQGQHLAGTTQEEFEHQQEKNPSGKTPTEADEEATVLKYVQRQSALEEEHRKQLADKGKGKRAETADDDENDEELQRALKISMHDSSNRGEASGT